MPLRGLAQRFDRACVLIPRRVVAPRLQRRVELIAILPAIDAITRLAQMRVRIDRHGGPVLSGAVETTGSRPCAAPAGPRPVPLPDSRRRSPVLSGSPADSG